MGCGTRGLRGRNVDLWTVTCRPLRDLFVRIHDLVLLHVLPKALDVFLFAEVADRGVG